MGNLEPESKPLEAFFLGICYLSTVVVDSCFQYFAKKRMCEFPVTRLAHKQGAHNIADGTRLSARRETGICPLKRTFTVWSFRLIRSQKRVRYSMPGSCGDAVSLLRNLKACF